MSHPIISIEMIKRKAQADHARGVRFEDCSMPYESPAAKT